jgi:hypothetical protein
VTQLDVTADLRGVPGFAFVEEYSEQADADLPPEEKSDEGGFIDRDVYENTVEELEYDRVAQLDHGALTSVLRQQQRNRVPNQSGPVVSSVGEADVRTNNNAGTNGTSFLPRVKPL